MRNKHIIAFAVITLALLGIATPGLADKVDVRADTINGYGRILFTFDQTTKYKARLENGVLILEFDRVADFDLNQLRKKLPNYVALARRELNGQIFRFALKKDLRLHTSAAEARIAVDLVPAPDTDDVVDLRHFVKQAASDAFRQTAGNNDTLRPAGLLEIEHLTDDGFGFRT